ncbi:hypothetical protein ES708_09739 [subsurface metagenome]
MAPDNNSDSDITKVRLPLFFSIPVSIASVMIIIYILLQLLQCCGK